MKDRKLISEERYDEAVMAVLDEIVDAECPKLAVLAATMFARLAAELFEKREKPEVNESEEKLIRAVSKDDAQH